ncbi:MAG: TIGR03435 family protein [Acidobacteria bacterium]|nr:TIGR03435 family protein [Acidobacteriota bacterium]
MASMVRLSFHAAAALFASVACSAALGQSPEPKPKFEVASIRQTGVNVAGGEGSTRSQIQTAPDGLTLRNIDVDEMVEWAYSLTHNQIANPGSLHNHRFDVRARSANPVSEKTLRIMLQDLISTRFSLKLHREQKSTSVYELVVSKNGPRLPPNKADKLPASYPRETFPRVVDGSFVFSNVSMADFAQQLTEIRGIDFPVIDRTGIPGVYDITLTSAAAAVRDPSGPSIVTLVQEQLGLKLVSAKDPIEVVVIDRVEEPSDN